MNTYKMLSDRDGRTEIDGKLQFEWLGIFKREGGDREFINHHPELNEHSIVLDLGSYDGNWSNIIWEKYKCNIFAIEPHPDLFKIAVDQYKNIKFFNCVLGNETKDVFLELNDNKSMIVASSDTSVKMFEFYSFLTKHKIKQVDLLKINIEGGEFDILDHLLSDMRKIKKIKSILIQFHYSREDAITARAEIISKMSKYYNVDFSFPFVWEKFTLK